jgi:hypothetical protein
MNSLATLFVRFQPRVAFLSRIKENGVTNAKGLGMNSTHSLVPQIRGTHSKRLLIVEIWE